jgi:chromosomal replication initiation ATPase DnaA
VEDNVIIVSKSPVAEAPHLAGLDPKRIFAAVVDFYELDDGSLSRRLDPLVARAVAAWLCRRHTEATLRELATWLGLSRADRVPNLTRRLEARLKASPELSSDLAEILKQASTRATSVHRTEPPRRQVSERSGRSKTRKRA